MADLLDAGSADVAPGAIRTPRHGTRSLARLPFRAPGTCVGRSRGREARRLEPRRAAVTRAVRPGLCEHVHVSGPPAGSVPAGRLLCRRRRVRSVERHAVRAAGGHGGPPAPPGRAHPDAGPRPRARFLGSGPPPPPPRRAPPRRDVRLEWQEMPERASIAPRTLAIDLSGLAPGRYVLEVAVTPAGAETVTAHREILIERP